MLESTIVENENQNPEIVKKEISIDKIKETPHLEKLKSEFSFDSASKNILIGNIRKLISFRANKSTLKREK